MGVSTSLPDWQDKLEGLARAKGSPLDGQEFHSAVNVVFHDVESKVYDAAHQEMWVSLRPVMELLSQDALPALDEAPLILADIGCGTGLATSMLMATQLGHLVTRIVGVDTSAGMLERCRARSSEWGRPVLLRQGTIDILADASVDLLVTSSVLHHIPDIKAFCAQIARVLRPRGVFMHLQDPAAGRTTNATLQARSQVLAEVEQRNRAAWLSWPRALRLPFSAWKRFNHWRDQAYLREVNLRLLRAGVIQRPMTSHEIWSVTDIHVDGLPYASGQGIGRETLSSGLSEFHNVSFRTYGFYGKLLSHLPPALVAKELEWLGNSCPDGSHVAGVWVKGLL